MNCLAEYIWLDGNPISQELRSKTRVMCIDDYDSVTLEHFPEWGFDGSSTQQAVGSHSDCILKPVQWFKDPTRQGSNYLVLCEVYNIDKTPHCSNTRAHLREILAQGGEAHEPWLGFEQEYTLFKNEQPLGWPKGGFPRPQGPYYCGVGADKAFGREICEKHLEYCIQAGLYIYGTNAEVMPGQWEYQIGYRGFKGDHNHALNFCDHQQIARWLLQRVAEEAQVVVSFDNKPVKGDWNGAGCHTNFSTKHMRDPQQGLNAITKACQLLKEYHEEHIKIYGHNLSERLTGLHETCSIHEFKSEVSDRGASIRIPAHVDEQGYGYLEDRRPGANSDPYLVAAKLIETICEVRHVHSLETI